MRPPDLGSVFDSRYRLDRVLGAGGFAQVFEATDLRTPRTVAIKVLTPTAGLYDPNTRARFEREVQLVARLRSPHSVRLFDYGESDQGLLYLVFELVGGRDLSELLTEVDTLDEPTVDHVLRQVLRALAEAHALGLLHRDIKPDNIRVFRYMGDPWSVKLLDFGVARELVDGDRAPITQDGALVGTPRYMSPEQLRSEELTPASDIYSLGLTAYEMLMGQAAMHGLRLGDQLERLAKSSALQIPGTQAAILRGVVHRMVAREPHDRYATAAQVIEALDHATGSGPQVQAVSAPPPAAHVRGRAARPPSRSDISTSQLVGGAILACVLVMTALVAMLVLVEEEPPPPLRHVILPMTEPLPVARIADVGSTVTVEPPPDLGTRGSTGCGQDAPHYTRKKMHDRRGRDVIVYVPTSYDRHQPAPLVLMFHDALETSNSLWWDSGFLDVAEKYGVIVAVPRDALLGDWTDPVDLFAGRDAIEMLEEKLCLDFDRVYAVGNGAGGTLVEELACQMPEIKAFATMSYVSPGTISCPQRAIPYIHFAALKDEHLPPDGGKGCLGAVRSLNQHEQAWRTRNGCDATRTEHSRWKRNRCWTWSCDTPFVSCQLDAGRGWPGRTKARQYGSAECDGTSQSKYDMAGEIWSFFEKTQPSPP